MDVIDKFESIFKDDGLLLLADTMAQRYGKTPYEILSCMTVFEFNFNVAVMSKAIMNQKKQEEGPTQEQPQDGKPANTDWKSVGIKRTVKKRSEVKEK